MKSVAVFVPAAVVAGMTLQRAGGAGQPHTSEGVVMAEGGVGQAAEAIRLLLVEVFPVGLEARRARGVRPKQVGVQLVDDLLTDAGLKLPGEEGGSGRLLWREKTDPSCKRSVKHLTVTAQPPP